MTPDEYRTLADEGAEVPGVGAYDWIKQAWPALRTAADDIERLQHEIQGWSDGARLLREERDRLLAAIEDAPHDRDAACGSGYAAQEMPHCTCWKADTL